HAESHPREPVAGGLRPLHEGDTPGAEIVAQQSRVLVLQPLQPVQVQMRDGHAPAPVAVTDAEARAGDRVRDPERPRRAAPARARPRQSVVFPAPSAPCTSTTSPSRRLPASSAPSDSVSPGPVVSTIRTATTRL